MEHVCRNIDEYEGDLVEIFSSAGLCCELMIGETEDEAEIVRLSMYMDEFYDFSETARHHIAVVLDGTTSIPKIQEIIRALNYIASDIFGDRFPSKRASALRIREALEADISKASERFRDRNVANIFGFQNLTPH